MTAEEFKEMTGADPDQDDLERVNCDRVGEYGHRSCGVCPEHNLPRFMCRCPAPKKEKEKVNAIWIVLWHDPSRADLNVGVHGLFSDETMARSETEKMNRDTSCVYWTVSYVVTPKKEIPSGTSDGSG